MAWFDYLANLGQGLEQGAQTFRAQRQQIQALARQQRLDQQADEDRQREQLKEQLALLAPDADLTPEEAAPFMQAFGKGAFTVSPVDKTRVRRRQAPAEELAGLQLADTKAQREARRLIESGITSTQPLEKNLALFSRAGLDPFTSGFLPPDQAQALVQRNATMVAKYQAQIRDLEQKALAAQLRADSAAATAGERARLAEVAGQWRQQIESAKLAQQREIATSGQFNRLLIALINQGMDPAEALQLMPVGVTELPGD